MYYYLTLSSSIDPQRNTTQALSMLSAIFDIKWQSPSVYHQDSLKTLCIVHHGRLKRCQLKRIEYSLGGDISVNLAFSSTVLDPLLYQQLDEKYVHECLTSAGVA